MLKLRTTSANAAATKSQARHDCYAIMSACKNKGVLHEIVDEVRETCSLECVA